MKTLHNPVSADSLRLQHSKTKLQIHEEIEYQSGTKELIFLWNDSVEFLFSGDPAPQGSKVATRWGGMKEVSNKIKPWRDAIQYHLHQDYKGRITGPICLSAVFKLKRPKNHWSSAKDKVGQLLPSAPSAHVTTPDNDKLTRGVIDPFLFVVVETY